MIIKKSDDNFLMRTPRERRSELRNRNELQQRSNFQELIQNPTSRTHEKFREERKAPRTTRTFTLGSLEKREPSQRSSSKLEVKAAPPKCKQPRFCSRHPTKPATHEAIDDQSQQMVYCEKCSIGLASRGWRLKRFDAKLEKQPRCKDELDRFMNNLNLVLSELLQRKDDTNSNIKRCETEFGKQIEEINEYFSMLELTLEMEKNRQYTHILSLKKDAEIQQRRLCGIYEKCIEELNKILDNIVVMKENITNDYEQIVEEFSPRLQRYSEIVRSGPSKFTIKPLRLNNIDDVDRIFRELISSGESCRFTKSIMSQLQESESGVRTDYNRSVQAEPQVQSPQESNLITQDEDRGWKPANSDILIRLIN